MATQTIEFFNDHNLLELLRDHLRPILPSRFPIEGVYEGIPSFHVRICSHHSFVQRIINTIIEAVGHPGRIDGGGERPTYTEYYWFELNDTRGRSWALIVRLEPHFIDIRCLDN